MSPQFRHDDYVVSLRWPRRYLRPGRVVVIRHPALGTIIKRIAEIRADGCIALSGDNPASTSREAMGWVTPDRVIGQVIWHIAQKREPRNMLSR